MYVVKKQDGSEWFDETDAVEMSIDELADAAATQGVRCCQRNYYVPGPHKPEALAFMRQRLGDDRYGALLQNARARANANVVARIVLSPLDWAKYAYIEQTGSLDGFDESYE